MSSLNIEDYNALVTLAGKQFENVHNIGVSFIDHRKTGKRYFIIDTELIQCTNGHEDEKCVLYSDGLRYYVREKTEFQEKFW